ncbi:MAG: arylsulfatase [Pirellulales bacterium]|nr:arylsulfatase [Pirellulales bacterium]
MCSLAQGAAADRAPARPNIVLVLADDLGFSDLGCYGSRIATPNLDRLAAGGLRFTQFYNAARCCPTRAALLTGLYPHEAGVGHMLGEWGRPAYSGGLNEHCATFAELLHAAGYRTYHVGKWHVGGVGGRKEGAALGSNHPLRRGFDRTFGTAGGGDFFKLRPLYLDDAAVEPDDKFYATDAFSDWGERFVREHGRDHAGQPFLLNLCYTAPHFPLQAKPEDIAKYRGKFRDGWDAERARRFARQKELGIVSADCPLSPRDPMARAWDDVPETERDEWDLRMAVHAAMVDCLDQGVGRVLAAVRDIGAERNTLVLFLSDNGASAEFLDSWPDPARGHRPGSETGTPDSHRCLEIGWANAATTPFRENKMWAHEGGIATPLIACWPAGITSRGGLTNQVGHIIDIVPTLLELAGVKYPAILDGRELRPLAGLSLAPVFAGGSLPERTLGWEHEGNRAIRVGDWKLVAAYRGPWELYDLAHDRSETRDLAAAEPERAGQLAAAWQAWADRVGVVPWEQLPGANYKPTAKYRKKSEPVAAE